MSSLSAAESKPKWNNWKDSIAQSFVRRPQATTIQLQRTARRAAAPCSLAPLLFVVRRRPGQLDEPLGGRALSAQSPVHYIMGPTTGERPILISQATGEFQQCALERLRDFLEYNDSSCCQAFMVMLHSVEEWWISCSDGAGWAPRPSCCWRNHRAPRSRCWNDGLGPNLGMYGGMRLRGLRFDFFFLNVFSMF